MLELVSFGSKMEIKKKEEGYIVKFEVSYDSDNDDTVSYALINNSSIEKLKTIFTTSNIMRIKTESNDVELLIGASTFGAQEVFFSLIDYVSDEKERDTKKIYRINISKDTDNYRVFDALIALIEQDISFAKENEDEYKFNTPKY